MLSIECFKILARIILYILLFVFFCSFYMIDQMADYIKGRTTVTSRFEEVESQEPPTITVCMHPLFKSTSMASYGLTDQGDVLYEDFIDETLEDRLEFLSYLLGRDYEIEMTVGYMGPGKTLSEGMEIVGNLSYEVQPIQTLAYGTCYKIQPSFMLFSVPFDCNLRISLTSNLQQADIPLTAIIYLTSNNTWQSITTSDWPQFTPSKIELTIGNSYYYQFKATEYLFSQGVENSEDCWKRHLNMSSCKTKCKWASFTDLPMCNSSQEVTCLMFDEDIGEPYNDCNCRKRSLTYHGDLTKLAKYSSNNATNIEISILSFTKEVREEIEVITFSNLIGSLGGSLGMFFGFSISTYVLYLLDKFVIKIMTYQTLFTSP